MYVILLIKNPKVSPRRSPPEGLPLQIFKSNGLIYVFNSLTYISKLIKLMKLKELIKLIKILIQIKIIKILKIILIKLTMELIQPDRPDPCAVTKLSLKKPRTASSDDHMYHPIIPGYNFPPFSSILLGEPLRSIVFDIH